MRFTSPIAVAVPLQRAARDGPPVVARDEDRRVGVGHLLDGQVGAELGRRQLEQRGVERRDQGADIVLQRALDGDRDGHGRNSTERAGAARCGSVTLWG